MKTAVVILNWNTEGFLREFLPGLIRSAQKVEGAEVVVADNASTDGCMDVMKNEFPQVKTLQFEKNHGFTGGYNKAFSQIDSDYFVLINSDIEVTEDWLQPLVDWMESHPECGACAPKLHSWQERDMFEYAGAAGGYLDRFGYPFCRGRVLKRLEKDNGQYDSPADVLWATGACLMVRSSAYRKLGGLDERFFAHMEEIDLQWRMQLAGWRIVVEPKSVVYHLGGGTLPASSRKIFLNHRNNLAMLFKCASPMQRAVVAVVRPATDMLEAFVNLVALHPQRAWAIVRAWGEFIAWHGVLSRKRKAVVRTKKVDNIYRNSIILRYIFGRRKFNNMM